MFRLEAGGKFTFSRHTFKSNSPEDKPASFPSEPEEKAPFIKETTTPKRETFYVIAFEEVLVRATFLEASEKLGGIKEVLIPQIGTPLLPFLPQEVLIEEKNIIIYLTIAKEENNRVTIVSKLESDAVKLALQIALHACCVNNPSMQKMAESLKPAIEKITIKKVSLDEDLKNDVLAKKLHKDFCLNAESKSSWKKSALRYFLKLDDSDELFNIPVSNCSDTDEKNVETNVKRVTAEIFEPIPSYTRGSYINELIKCLLQEEVDFWKKQLKKHADVDKALIKALLKIKEKLHDKLDSEISTEFFDYFKRYILYFGIPEKYSLVHLSDQYRAYHMTYEQIVSSMRRKSMPKPRKNGLLEILAIQNILKRSIIIINEFGEVTAPENMFEYKRKPIFIFDRGFGFYSLLRLKPNISPEKAMEKLRLEYHPDRLDPEALMLKHVNKLNKAAKKPPKEPAVKLLTPISVSAPKSVYTKPVNTRTVPSIARDVLKIASNSALEDPYKEIQGRIQDVEFCVKKLQTTLQKPIIVITAVGVIINYDEEQRYLSEDCKPIFLLRDLSWHYHELELVNKSFDMEVVLSSLGIRLLTQEDKAMIRNVKDYKRKKAASLGLALDEKSSAPPNSSPGNNPNALFGGQEQDASAANQDEENWGNDCFSDDDNDNGQGWGDQVDSWSDDDEDRNEVKKPDDQDDWGDGDELNLDPNMFNQW